LHAIQTDLSPNPCPRRRGELDSLFPTREAGALVRSWGVRFE